MKIPLLCLFIVAFAGVCSHSFSQDFAGYRPGEAYNDDDPVVDSLVTRLELQMLSIKGSSKNPWLVQLSEARVANLKQFFKQKLVVRNDSLEGYLMAIMDHILPTRMYALPRKIFILRSPYPNAWCYGGGIYFITSALLGNLRNMDELAFVIAHEMAHDELRHVENNMVRETTERLSKKTSTSMQKILYGTADVQDIQEFKELARKITSFNRMHELQADSLGFKLFAEAGFDANKGIKAIDVLEANGAPKYSTTINMIMQLHSENYPFQEAWLSERLSVYSSVIPDDFLFQRDSMTTHPAFDKRREYLKSFVQDPVYNDTVVTNDHHFDNLSVVAAFETVEGAYVFHNYDQCLYYALQLLNRYPKNGYLISRIGKVLTDLYSVVDVYSSGNKAVFYQFVRRYTANYCDEMRLINNILHNLSHDELGEVAYHFLESRQYERAHYYLLSEICRMTHREEALKDIHRKYKSKFKQNLASFRYE